MSRTRRGLGDRKRFERDCAALSRRLPSREAVMVVGTDVIVYREGERVLHRTWEEHVTEEDEEADDGGTLQVRLDEEAEAGLDGYLRSRGILLPPCGWDGDGLHAFVELRGVKRKDVERLDLVVLGELPEPT